MFRLTEFSLDPRSAGTDSMKQRPRIRPLGEELTRRTDSDLSNKRNLDKKKAANLVFGLATASV